ncbi:hypothetical protein K504DRAFT_491752 [Pleomassaria siparia CBS 279.74]|uniref:Uncharacterized protein n=1 Tax=Pleomassaria siparia CBS 279.74 TaxID=1314801 RepID=A0A6G1K6B6_9PLEO|nr:hypothetical protein K504DRAFT_491752 [Pleomassaria siparia CBS 279.74]
MRLFLTVARLFGVGMEERNKSEDGHDALKVVATLLAVHRDIVGVKYVSIDGPYPGHFPGADKSSDSGLESDVGNNSIITYTRIVFVIRPNAPDAPRTERGQTTPPSLTQRSSGTANRLHRLNTPSRLCSSHACTTRHMDDEQDTDLAERPWDMLLIRCWFFDRASGHGMLYLPFPPT